jgi:hypothetical protein
LLQKIKRTDGDIMAVTTKGQVDDYKSISSKEIKDVIESLFEPREIAHFEKQKQSVIECSI